MPLNFQVTGFRAVAANGDIYFGVGYFVIEPPMAHWMAAVITPGQPCDVIAAELPDEQSARAACDTHYRLACPTEPIPADAIRAARLAAGEFVLDRDLIEKSR